MQKVHTKRSVFNWQAAIEVQPEKPKQRQKSTKIQLSSTW
jgi:hypothetical protein